MYPLPSLDTHTAIHAKLSWGKVRGQQLALLALGFAASCETTRRRRMVVDGGHDRGPRAYPAEVL